jgi:hypothetical protein
MEMASASEPPPISWPNCVSLGGNQNAIMLLCFVPALWQNSYTFLRPNYTGAR